MQIRKPTKKLRRVRAGAVRSAEPAIREVFQVVAQCADEDAQRELYERLRGEGYECKLLLL